jgi:hypothetical protein
MIQRRRMITPQTTQLLSILLVSEPIDVIPIKLSLEGKMILDAEISF